MARESNSKRAGRLPVVWIFWAGVAPSSFVNFMNTLSSKAPSVLAIPLGPVAIVQWQKHEEERTGDQRARDHAQAQTIGEVGEQRSRKCLDGNGRAEEETGQPSSAPRVFQKRPIEKKGDEDIGLAEDEVVYGKRGDQQSGEPLVPRPGRLGRGEAEKPRETKGKVEEADVHGVPGEE